MVDQQKKQSFCYRLIEKTRKKGFAGVTVEQDKIIKGIISQESALDNLVNKDKERTKELENSKSAFC